MKTLVANNDWMREAFETAKLRRAYHRMLGSRRHWHDENKGEIQDEYFGSLAQIAFREKMREEGLINVCRFAPLYVDDLSLLPAWDFTAPSGVKAPTIL